MSKYFLFTFLKLTQKIINNITVKIEQRHGDTNGGTDVTNGANVDTSVSNGGTLAYGVACGVALTSKTRTDALALALALVLEPKTCPTAQLCTTAHLFT
jgi:hypothetical protein